MVYLCVNEKIRDMRTNAEIAILIKEALKNETSTTCGFTGFKSVHVEGKVKDRITWNGIVVAYGDLPKNMTIGQYNVILINIKYILSKIEEQGENYHIEQY